MENTNGNATRGLGDSPLPPPPPINGASLNTAPPPQSSYEALFPASEELTVFPEPATPWLSRVRKGWNEIMLMTLSTVATVGTGGAILLALWWLAGEAGVRP
jgi:hypothetical protein